MVRPRDPLSGFERSFGSIGTSLARGHQGVLRLSAAPYRLQQLDVLRAGLALAVIHHDVER